MRVGEVDVVDDTFVRAAPAEVRCALDSRGLPSPSPARWPMRCEVTDVEDRGAKGVRWASTGSVVGSMEIWLEPVAGGTVVHHYARGVARHRWLAPQMLARAHTVRWKRLVHEVKDEAERRAHGGG